MGESTFTVSRSTTIGAPPSTVYELLSNFHNWPNWSPWEELDPNMEREFSGAEAGEGAEYAWSGNKKAGKGRMKIIEAVTPSKVRIALSFEKPFKSENTTSFTITGQGSNSEVNWTMKGPKSIFSRVMVLFGGMDKMIGKDFEKGLANLKREAERL
ncbi:SRPBCC family protein [Hoyosella altamirensis]|uniref:Uncharacterized protein YndB with AHSA1/START domain n=1 Tax=Hoyosella altamirensis TaxID=616997 RepID=A0A839RPR0_9ACTN|nr:SRPBCC family protein [Hoyosella altamirensis]MBB3038198.1 uncharacterized protein YndB with AHSA1/START domain [Hoyosella altamirensis]